VKSLRKQNESMENVREFKMLQIMINIIYVFEITHLKDWSNAGLNPCNKYENYKMRYVRNNGINHLMGVYLVGGEGVTHQYYYMGRCCHNLII
jgi:hypothetical protein